MNSNTTETTIYSGQSLAMMLLLNRLIAEIASLREANGKDGGAWVSRLYMEAMNATSVFTSPNAPPEGLQSVRQEAQTTIGFIFKMDV